jgi:hypothetical protein
MDFAEAKQILQALDQIEYKELVADGTRGRVAVAEMPGPPPRAPLDPENLRISVALMDLACRLSGFRHLPGARQEAPDG